MKPCDKMDPPLSLILTAMSKLSKLCWMNKVSKKQRFTDKHDLHKTYPIMIYGTVII